MIDTGSQPKIDRVQSPCPKSPNNHRCNSGCFDNLCMAWPDINVDLYNRRIISLNSPGSESWIISGLIKYVVKCTGNSFCICNSLFIVDFFITLFFLTVTNIFVVTKNEAKMFFKITDNWNKILISFVIYLFIWKISYFHVYRGDYSIKKQKSNTKLYCLLFINRSLPQPPEDDKIKKTKIQIRCFHNCSTHTTTMNL